MSSSTMVSMQIDNSTICWMDAPVTALSHAAVLVCCVLLLLAPVQEQCRSCGKWIKRATNRTHICLDCRHQQEQQEDLPTDAPTAAAASSPPLFEHGDIVHT